MSSAETQIIRQDVGHYSYAIDLLIRQALGAATDAHERAVILKRTDAMMTRWPVMQYRPLPQAIRFHRSRKRFRWCFGGNRSSKSESVAQEVAWWATGTHPFRRIKTPNVGWYATVNWDMVGEILWQDKLLDKLSGFDYDVIWHNRNRAIPEQVHIRVPGGTSRIVFKSYEQGRKAFQGTDRTYIANDEQFDQGIYLEQISRIGAGDPLQFFAALTPIEPQPWLEEKVSFEKPDTWDIFEYPLDDNRISYGGFIPDDVIDDLINEWPEEVQVTRRNGKFASFIGAVYKSFSREIHVIHEDEERRRFLPRGYITQDLRCYAGIDFGANNPFVFLLGVRLPQLEDAWYIFDEYRWEGARKGIRLYEDHCKQIKDMCERWKAPFKYGWADHDAQGRAEMNKLGIITRPALKDRMLDGIECVQSYLKVRNGTPRLYISSRCRQTIRELIGLKWAEGGELRNPAEGTIEVDDHGPDALRYLIFSEEYTAGRYRPAHLGDRYKRVH